MKIWINKHTGEIHKGNYSLGYNWVEVTQKDIDQAKRQQKTNNNDDDGLLDLVVGVGLGLVIDNILDGAIGGEVPSDFGGGGGDFGGGGSSGDW